MSAPVEDLPAVVEPTHERVLFRRSVLEQAEAGERIDEIRTREGDVGLAFTWHDEDDCVVQFQDDDYIAWVLPPLNTVGRFLLVVQTACGTSVIECDDEPDDSLVISIARRLVSISAQVVPALHRHSFATGQVKP